ncbi:immunoglobulin-like domain-containing protein [Stigmatella aurantiaca]|uniref:immunoglobulin-like domain-containing protein n=1 Tax=Stigmatella aurantiaca TaxID=41 RepID=UPI001FEB97DB|nr:immunoglobulin-like domain-containing protein [Stigmatella aurantiaca]
MLILGTTVTGGQSSREAQAAASIGYPATVVTPAQWSAMTPEQFQQYAGIIIGDAACQGGESAFQAAVDNRNIWGAAVDGNVVISGSDATNNGTPLFIENIVSTIVAQQIRSRTGMYISLGCAYQGAAPGTPVPLLEPFGSFTVAGTGCYANGGHIFRMYPEGLSDGLYGNDGELSGTGGCATRVVFSNYPDKTFATVAIAVDNSGSLPNSREYWDYLMEDPDSFKTFIGTPYVLTQSAMAFSSGCGQGSEPMAMCDQSPEGNGKPAQPGAPADATCSFSCQQQWCGNGHVDAEQGEECDDGFFNGRTRDGNGAIGACTAFCKIPNFETESPPDALCKNLELVADLTCGADGNVNNGSWDPDEDLVGCQQSPVGPYGPGTTTVTLTCMDSQGNTDSCTATITVLDQNKPTLTLVGSNEQLECSPGLYTDPGATAADVCEGDMTGAIAVSGTVNPSAVGQYELTYNVEDSSGNAATPVQRTVTVSDTLPPTLALNGPAPQALECGSPYADPGATALDACAGDLTGAVTRSGEVNPNVPNTYTVIYNASDPSGQSAPSVTRQVNVSDTLAPVITVQGPVSDTFECGSEYTDPGATANDQCYGNLTSAVIATRTTIPGQPGNFTLTYSVQDPAGNVATSPVTRTVKVNDDTPPSIALNGEVYVTVECSEPFVDPGAKAVDLCAGDVPVTVSGTVDTTQAGNYMLSYSAQDPAGNTSATVTRTVQVNDSLPPALTLLGENPMSLECKRDTYVEPGATASDLCSGSSTVVASENIDESVPGYYAVNYTATDKSGRQSTAIRDVNVVDTLPPAFETPAPLTLECAIDTINDPLPKLIDLCRGDLSANVRRVFSNVDRMRVGNYVIQYQGIDDQPGSWPIYVDRDVHVTDTRAPVITVMGPTESTLECGMPYMEDGVMARDACFGNVWVTRTQDGNPRSPSSFTIKYSAMDPMGNSSSATVKVTVSDNKPPNLELWGSSIEELECGTPYVDPGAIAFDMCFGNVTDRITVTGAINNKQLGAQTLTYNVTDPSGKKAPAVSRTVNVGDTLAPVITVTGPLATTIECGDEFNDPGATANDACVGAVPAVPTTVVNPSAEGTYSIQYTAQDTSGNTATSDASRTVTVADTLPPTMALNGPASLPLECAMPFNDPGATANDQCAGDVSHRIQTSGGINNKQLGAQTLTYSVKDPGGRAAVPVNRTVTVDDTLAPVITLKGPLSDTYECGGQYIDPGATAADACAGDLTGHIVATRSPVPGQPGTFTISYSVQDPSGNKAVAPATRIVREGGIQVRLSDFNVFLFEDYTLGSDVEGRVAAGGNISMKNFSVGWELPSSDTAPVLVAGGNLSLTQGGVWGDAAYGGTYSASNVTYVRGAPSKSTPVDFPTRSAEVRKLSTQLDSLPTNGLTRRESWGGLMLTGSSQDVNVFNVNASDLSSTVLLSIDAPAGSLAVLNIHGTSAKLAGGHVFSGGIDQQGVLFNFVDATSINAQGYGLWGTLLAPNAHVNFTNGSFDGGIYAKSLSGNAEGHLNPLRERVICNGPSFVAQLGGE